jgi:hypothetical protein
MPLLSQRLCDSSGNNSSGNKNRCDSIGNCPGATSRIDATTSTTSMASMARRRSSEYLSHVAFELSSVTRSR